MLSEVDEFDLDIRIHTTHDRWFVRPRPQHFAPDVRAADTGPEATCGCNTIETCDQLVDSCSPQACGISFDPPYCEGGTDGCGNPGPGGGDPADTDFCHLDVTNNCP